jgi:hypothetical protein
MKACIGIRGTPSLILNLGTRWRWVQNVMFLPFLPWTKNYNFPLDRRLHEPQSQSTFWWK